MFVVRIGPHGSPYYMNGRTRTDAAGAREYPNRMDAYRAALARCYRDNWFVEDRRPDRPTDAKPRRG